MAVLYEARNCEQNQAINMAKNTDRLAKQLIDFKRLQQRTLSQPPHFISSLLFALSPSSINWGAIQVENSIIRAIYCLWHLTTTSSCSEAYTHRAEPFSSPYTLYERWHLVRISVCLFRMNELSREQQKIERKRVNEMVLSTANHRMDLARVDYDLKSMRERETAREINAYISSRMGTGYAYQPNML